MKKSTVRVIGKGALATALVLGAGSASQAATYTWRGGAGSWHTASKWMPLGVPGSSDTVVVGSGVVSVSTAATVSNLSLGSSAEIQNASRLTVTRVTSSSGLVTGTGAVSVPAGATASFVIGAPAVASYRRRQAALGKHSISTIAFQDIENHGTLSASVGAGAQITFEKVKNFGTAQVAAATPVVFEDVENYGQTAVEAAGGATFKAVVNDGGVVVLSASGLSGSRAGKGAGKRGAGVARYSAGATDVVLEKVENKSGDVMLRGRGASGAAFRTREIKNLGRMTLSGAVAVLKDALLNGPGCEVVLDGSGAVVPQAGEAPKVENKGSLRKAGAGTYDLALEWVNEGAVRVEGGTLRLRRFNGKRPLHKDGRLTLDGGSLDVQNEDGSRGELHMDGGDLDGSGEINGDVLHNKGALNAGFSPGIITINGNYTQNPDGVLNMEVGGLGMGWGYDNLTVNGQSAFYGALNMVTWAGYVPPIGASFQILKFYSARLAFRATTLRTTTATYTLNVTTTTLVARCGANTTGVRAFSGAQALKDGPRLSAATALSDEGALDLRFDRALGENADDAGLYAVQINGVPAKVSAVERLGAHAVRLLLGPDALAPGDAVHVAWDHLADRKGGAASSGARLEAK